MQTHERTSPSIRSNQWISNSAFTCMMIAVVRKENQSETKSVLKEGVRFRIAKGYRNILRGRWRCLGAWRVEVYQSMVRRTQHHNFRQQYKKLPGLQKSGHDQSSECQKHCQRRERHRGITWTRWRWETIWWFYVLLDMRKLLCNVCMAWLISEWGEKVKEKQGGASKLGCRGRKPRNTIAKNIRISIRSYD